MVQRDTGPLSSTSWNELLLSQRLHGRVSSREEGCPQEGGMAEQGMQTGRLRVKCSLSGEEDIVHWGVLAWIALQL